MTMKPKTRRAHVVTEAEAAALNFEPSQELEMLPTNERFTEDGLGQLITCRFALAAMYKTKAELAEMLGQIENEDGDDLGGRSGAAPRQEAASPTRRGDSPAIASYRFRALKVPPGTPWN